MLRISDCTRVFLGHVCETQSNCVNMFDSNQFKAAQHFVCTSATLFGICVGRHSFRTSKMVKSVLMVCAIFIVSTQKKKVVQGIRHEHNRTTAGWINYSNVSRVNGNLIVTDYAEQLESNGWARASHLWKVECYKLLWMEFDCPICIGRIFIRKPKLIFYVKSQNESIVIANWVELFATITLKNIVHQSSQFFDEIRDLHISHWLVKTQFSFIGTFEMNVQSNAIRTNAIWLVPNESNDWCYFRRISLMFIFQ